MRKARGGRSSVLEPSLDCIDDAINDDTVILSSDAEEVVPAQASDSRNVLSRFQGSRPQPPIMGPSNCTPKITASAHMKPSRISARIVNNASQKGAYKSDEHLQVRVCQ